MFVCAEEEGCVYVNLVQKVNKEVGGAGRWRLGNSGGVGGEGGGVVRGILS